MSPRLLSLTPIFFVFIACSKTGNEPKTTAPQPKTWTKPGEPSYVGIFTYARDNHEPYKITVEAYMGADKDGDSVKLDASKYTQSNPEGPLGQSELSILNNSNAISSRMTMGCGQAADFTKTLEADEVELCGVLNSSAPVRVQAKRITLRNAQLTINAQSSSISGFQLKLIGTNVIRINGIGYGGSPALNIATPLITDLEGSLLIQTLGPKAEVTR